MIQVGKWVPRQKSDRLVVIVDTSYLSHPEDRHFFSGSMRSRSGSRVGVSRSFLDLISYHNFCPDRNTKFPKIPPDQSLRMDPEVFRAPDRLPNQIRRMTEV